MGMITEKNAKSATDYAALIYNRKNESFQAFMVFAEKMLRIYSGGMEMDSYVDKAVLSLAETRVKQLEKKVEELDEIIVDYVVTRGKLHLKMEKLEFERNDFELSRLLHIKDKEEAIDRVHLLEKRLCDLNNAYILGDTEMIKEIAMKAI